MGVSYSPPFAPISRVFKRVGAAVLAADVGGSGSGGSVAVSVTASFVAGRSYRATFGVSADRSSSGDLVAALTSIGLTLGTTATRGASVANAGVTGCMAGAIEFVASASGSIAVNLTCSAKQGGQSWTCNANTQAATDGHGAHLLIDEIQP